jgi:hypothetical protein
MSRFFKSEQTVVLLNVFFCLKNEQPALLLNVAALVLL